MKRGALFVAVSGVLASCAYAGGLDGTIFLDHFDSPIGQPPGSADYASGDPSEQVGPPFGPGGTITSSPAKFGAASIDRATGGRLQYNTQDNFNLSQGTIDMWVDSATLSGSGFKSLWGTFAAVGPGDVRMYIYDTGGGRTLGAYMIDSAGAATHWETEAVIPVASLTNNVWHHVAWEWSLATQQSNIYWDGTKIGSGATNGQTIRYNGDFAPTTFHIGESQFGSAPWPGYMDEFRISDVMRYNGVTSFTTPVSPYNPFTTWTTNNDGVWSVGGNWSPNTAPGGTGVGALFGSAISAPHTATLDSPRTLSQINFDNANTYTIAGSSTLTLDNTSGQVGVNVVSGSHVISAPLSLARTTRLTVTPSNGTLTLTNLQVSSSPIIKDGAGTVIANRVRSPSLTVSAGTLAIAINGGTSGVSKVGELSVAPSAKLDLTNNKLVTSSAAGTWDGAVYDGVSGAIAAGRNGGTWDGNGIVTSQTQATTSNLTTIGIASAAQVKGITATATAIWAGQTVTGSDTLVMYTYGGDANLDGKINVDDYGKIDSSAPLGIAGWYNGDFNYDGKINVDDYGIIDFNIGIQGAAFPTSSNIHDAATAAVQVPEPGSIGYILLGVTSMFLRSRAHRRKFCL